MAAVDAGLLPYRAGHFFAFFSLCVGVLFFLSKKNSRIVFGAETGDALSAISHGTERNLSSTADSFAY